MGVVFINLIQDVFNRDLLGKLLFVVGVGFLVCMVLSPLTHLLFHVDEFFTLFLVKLPLVDGITVTMHDFHPPLYYMILKLVTKFLSVLGIKYDFIFVLKLLSIVPYVIILGLSGTKIRKEYGWLSAGLLVFTLVIMSKFFMQYLTIRMYSWGLLFLLLSFVCLKGVLEFSDWKSWILLTVFTVLGAYTHYFVALSSCVIYVLLGAYILFNRKPDFDRLSEVKKWILSVVLAIVLYIPWIPSLINQLTKVHNNYWIPKITGDYLLRFIVYFGTADNHLYFAIFVVIVLFLFMVVLFRECKSVSDGDNFYILYGVLVFFGTLFVGVFLSLVYKPILVDRYLIPAVGVFWFAMSIFVGRLENKKLLTILLLLIFVLGGMNLISTVNQVDSAHDDGINNMNLLKTIDNENSIIICYRGSLRYKSFLNLNNDNWYTIKKNKLYGVSFKRLHKVLKFNEVPEDELDELINMNRDKNIYIIEDKNLGIGYINRTKLGNIGSFNFYMV